MGILINQGRQIGGLSEQDQANIGKVIQTETTTDAEYEILFSGTADNITRTEGAGKSEGMTYNANHKALTIGTRFPDSTIGDYSFSHGSSNTASGEYSHAEGAGTRANGDCSHTEGKSTNASGNYSHSEGYATFAYGDYNHAEGYQTYAGAESASSTTKRISAHAEGNNTKATGQSSHAEGQSTTASGFTAHAEGSGSTASEEGAHAEGKATASGKYSHAEGQTTASGNYSHAEGGGNLSSESVSYSNTASGQSSHAEGINTQASGRASHTEGEGTKASSKNQHVAGRYNIEDSDNIYAHIIGNGTDNYSRSNAFAVKWTGDIELKGDIEKTSGTWDGTHTSLLDTLANMDTSNKVSKTGDTMTGDLIMEHIPFEHDGYIEMGQDTTGQHRFIATYDDGEGTGQEIIINSEDVYRHRWSTVNGEDESGNISLPYDITEGLFGLLDGKVNKRGDTMSGQLNFSNINIANIQVPARSLSYINPSGNAGIYAKKDLNVDEWYPVVCMDTKSGGHWQIGNYNNDNLQFVFGTKTNRDASNNQVSIFNLINGNPGTAYTIAHSGNVGTGDSNGQVKIAGTNVSVKGLAAAAYKDVFTRSSVGDIGWGTTANRTKVVEASAIAFWNGCYSGTGSNLQYCDRGRFGTIVTKATGDYLPISGGTVTGYTTFKYGIDVNKTYSSGTTTNGGGIDLFGGNEAFIDFHRLYSSNDFTCRITQRADDTLDFIGRNSSTWGKLRAAKFIVESSIHVKENVEDITDEEASKLLQLRPVSFDYSDKDRSDRENHRGLIAEEVLEIYPEMVDIPNDYTEFNPEEPWKVPCIDYSKFVPYLIKMCQIQQEQIENLSARIATLEAKID